MKTSTMASILPHKITRSLSKNNGNEQQVFPTRKLTPLRGRTLGFLESSSTFHLRLYGFLSHPWTKALILCLIIFTVCVLISQASHSVLLPSDQSMPTSLKVSFLLGRIMFFLGCSSYSHLKQLPEYAFLDFC
ncbi:hypothetical protein EV424DRAFT_976341 [Suillus variegatus]|nr:hypothetical protein EV424DRAFT_976341 [Suillus variegatus]